MLGNLWAEGQTPPGVDTRLFFRFLPHVKRLISSHTHRPKINLYLSLRWMPDLCLYLLTNLILSPWPTFASWHCFTCAVRTSPPSFVPPFVLKAKTIRTWNWNWTSGAKHRVLSNTLVTSERIPNPRCAFRKFWAGKLLALRKQDCFWIVFVNDLLLP